MSTTSWLLALPCKTFIRELCQPYFLKQTDCLGEQTGGCHRETPGYDCKLYIQQVKRGHFTQKCQGTVEPAGSRVVMEGCKERKLVSESEEREESYRKQQGP